jgi:hypothetical protein
MTSGSAVRIWLLARSRHAYSLAEAEAEADMLSGAEQGTGTVVIGDLVALSCANNMDGTHGR